MPYFIKKFQRIVDGILQIVGYKVCKVTEPKKCFSKSPLPEERAKRQRTAIILSEIRRNKK